MNGCPYLQLISVRRKPYRGQPRKRAARRVAMCLANDAIQHPCQQFVRMRGERCHIYRKRKALGEDSRKTQC